jgi:Protein of unknown function (DUF3429)
MPQSPITPDSEAGVFIQRLGYAGMIPLVTLALLMWIVSEEAHPYVALAMSSWGAIIVAFLGGIHWGIGLRRNAPERKVHMVWGVIACICAWIAAMMPPFAGLPLLGLLLIACYLVDRKTWPQAGLREWMTMRFRLTVVCTLACLLGAAAT